MANTQRTREIEAIWAARPDLNPFNAEDAWYIICHPRENYANVAKQNDMTVEQFLAIADRTDHKWNEESGR